MALRAPLYALLMIGGALIWGTVFALVPPLTTEGSALFDRPFLSFYLQWLLPWNLQGLLISFILHSDERKTLSWFLRAVLCGGSFAIFQAYYPGKRLEWKEYANWFAYNIFLAITLYYFHDFVRRAAIVNFSVAESAAPAIADACSSALYGLVIGYFTGLIYNISRLGKDKEVEEKPKPVYTDSIWKAHPLLLLGSSIFWAFSIPLLSFIHILSFILAWMAQGWLIARTSKPAEATKGFGLLKAFFLGGFLAVFQAPRLPIWLYILWFILMPFIFLVTNAVFDPVTEFFRGTLQLPLEQSENLAFSVWGAIVGFSSAYFFSVLNNIGKRRAAG